MRSSQSEIGTTQSQATVMEENRIFCVIVGAGMTGVALADRILATGTLRRDEFVILDKNHDFGGVWETNIYPGVACDIPSHAYVMKTHLNPGWSKKFSEGREIQQYYANWADSKRLRENTVFGVVVHEARWNEDTLLWELLVEDRKSGAMSKWIANVLFDNGGGFYRAKFADIPGRENFKGEQWHTAHWPADADLRGKRVAMIGTGPSAAQAGPRIQPEVQKLYMYQRSCGHVLPRGNYEIPSWEKALFRWFYPILWLYHVSWLLFFDRTRRMWMSGTQENQACHEACINFLEREVKDPVVRDKLRPTVAFGCKRVLFLDDWYSLYNKSNVELVTEKPLRITEHGIVSRLPHALSDTDLIDQPVGAYQQKTSEADIEEVEREVDVLIWATGFDMNDSGGHFRIYGKKGMTLSETWKDYPQTYWGVAVTEFPNLFLTLGPNSVNYWSNITTICEFQINYHCKILKHIKKQVETSQYALYPNPEVQESFNKWLADNRTTPGTPTFLASNCATYHKTPSGATPMYNHLRIWDSFWKMRKVDWNDFVELRKAKLTSKNLELNTSVA